MGAAPTGDLQVEGLGLTLGAHRLLDDVDLAVAPGETLAVIGPSGAGKSTLLRCLNQLQRPTSGRVLLDGRDLVADGRDRRSRVDVHRRVGLVFQGFALFPHHTARGNVELAQVRALGRGADEARARADALLERVGLADRAEHRPHELSGGEQQRVAIARALALDPQVLLLDEPTSAIDPERRREVLAVVRDVAVSGVTTVLTTHEMRFAEHAADRVAFLADGRVLEAGSATQVLRDPRHERTRRFLDAVLDA